MNKIACLFPGQGSQSVGMGKDLFDTSNVAKETFSKIDSIAGRSLSKLCFEGPEEELKRTINTQPCILSMSLAAWQAYLAAGGVKPQYVAGHSLGEFTALVASGALTLESAVKLVDKRCRLMESCPPGAMTAVIGLAPEALKDICAQSVTELNQANQVALVANFNTREQLVISGSKEAIELAGTKAKAAGGKVIPLPVGGAFHSPLMASAAQEFEQEIQKADFSDAAIEVVQNFDAKPAKSAAELKAKLSKQMPNAVLWCNTIEYLLAQDVRTFVEIGPGKALAGMIKKIDRTASVFNIYNSVTLSETIAGLKEKSLV